MSPHEHQKPPKQYAVVDDGTPEKKVACERNAHWSFSLAATTRLARRPATNPDSTTASTVLATATSAMALILKAALIPFTNLHTEMPCDTRRI